MTDDRMALKAALEKASDTELLSHMLGFVAEKLMALDVDTLCNASRHERTGDRANYRNGYRERSWETRAGTVDLKVPKLRKGTYIRMKAENLWKKGDPCTLKFTRFGADSDLF
jgi:transposase-like protein